MFILFQFCFDIPKRKLAESKVLNSDKLLLNSLGGWFNRDFAESIDETMVA